MWTQTEEETRLVREYSETRAMRRTLIASAIGTGILGIAILPVGFLLWGIAGVLGIVAARQSHQLDRIRGRVSDLRSFPNPQKLKPGVLVSLIPDPQGLSSDRLVGRVGTLSEDGGDAEIVSKPLEGKQWVSKHSGSFSIEKGDWVVFHREEDGELTIWKEGPMYRELLERAEWTGDEQAKKLADLQKLNQAQGRAAGALEDLLQAHQEMQGWSDHDKDDSSSSPSDSGPNYDGGDYTPEVWTEKDIIEHFGITDEYFSIKYKSYSLSLGLSGKSSRWNDDIDDFARERGALTEREMTIAQSDFHQAVLNRVKLALTAELMDTGD